MSYSGNPVDSPLDEVRFIIGDTDPLNEQLTDAEISYLVNKYGIIGAAIKSVESLIAKYAKEVSRSIGSLSISASDKHKHYLSLLAQLRRNALLVNAAPWAEVNDRPFFTREGVDE